MSNPSPKPIKVIFNDAHANLPLNGTVPQGGTTRFSETFSTHFKNSFPDVELVSLLFSHNKKDSNVYLWETEGIHKFYEIVYPRAILHKDDKTELTKKRYKELLTPMLDQVAHAFDVIKPDVVFLNGFSLTNWLMLETAFQHDIPVCIQHAGLWKKELLVSKAAFPPSVKRILSSFEKDVISKASHQIFLNEFSRDEFFKLHHTPQTKKILQKTSIVPLPVTIPPIHAPMIPEKESYAVGMVGRWDRIKNHSAVYRLASYIDKHSIPLSIRVVTKWAEGVVSEFKDKYEKIVTIVPPMSPLKLQDFYRAQDIIIIPSRFDVSPTVLMESVLSGKPVIISENVGWVSDYRKFGLEKLIISPTASGETIANAILWLIKNKAKNLEKFALLQKKIIAEHNPQAVFQQYYAIFKQLL